jgi:hypothetical protein
MRRCAPQFVTETGFSFFVCSLTENTPYSIGMHLLEVLPC